MAENDFQEIVSSFQQMIDDLRKEPAQIISDDSIKAAETISKRTAERTEHQRAFARSLGEGVVQARLLSQIQERDLILAKSKEGIKGSELEHIKAELSLLQASIKSNRSLSDALNEQIERYGEVTGYAKDLSKFQQNIVALQLKLVELESIEAKTLAPDLVAKKREELMVRIHANEQAELHNQQLNQMEKVHERMGQVFGINVKSFNSGLAEAKAQLSSTSGRLGLIGIALGTIFKSVINDLVTIRHESGASLQQTLKLGGVALGGIATSARSGIALGGKDAAQLTGELAAHFGDLSRVTGQSVANAARLQIIIGLSAQDAAVFEANLEKIPGITPKIAKDTIQTADMIARINDIAPGQLFKTMAENSALMARYGREGQEEFAKAAAYATRIQVDLSKLDQFADRSLDISDMIGQFTKLGTLGIDLGDPLGLARLSESGDLEGFAQEIGQRLAESGLDLTIQSLGRTRAKALEQATGMSLVDLQRLASGAGEAALKGTEQMTDQQKAAVRQQEKQDAAITSIGHLATASGIASAALYALAAASLLNIGKGGVGGALGAVRGGLGRVVGGARGLLGGVGGAIRGGIGALGSATGLGGTVGAAGAATTGGVIAGGLAGGLAIGTGITEALHMDSLLDFGRIRRSERRGEAAHEEYLRIRARTEALHQAVAARRGGETPGITTSTADSQAVAAHGAASRGVEDKLTELIHFFKHGGITVMLDGKRVGKLLSAAQPRETTTAVIG